MNENIFTASELHQVSQTLFESQQATNKQMLRLLYMHREELFKQIEQFERGLESNLESYDSALSTVISEYQRRRQELYHSAITQLMIIHNCHKPETSTAETQANGVVNHG